jgi:hypothetical protein
VNNQTAAHAVFTNESAIANLDLDFKVRVLVKFRVNKLSMVPAGIRKVDRAPDIKVDVAHQMAAMKQGLDPEIFRLGRHRVGRVDTGVPIIRNPELSHAALIRRGLINNDFQLADLYFYEQAAKGTEPWHKPSYVITAVYLQYDKSQKLDVTPDVTKALRALSAMAWKNCEIWDNPDASVTINFGGREGNPNVKPKNAIRISGRTIIATPVQEFTREEEE